MRLNKFGIKKTKKKFGGVDSEQNENGNTNKQPSLKNNINMIYQIIELITKFFSMIGTGFCDGINGIKKFFQDLKIFKKQIEEETNTGDEATDKPNSSFTIMNLLEIIGGILQYLFGGLFSNIWSIIKSPMTGNNLNNKEILNNSINNSIYSNSKKLMALLKIQSFGRRLIAKKRMEILQRNRLEELILEYGSLSPDNIKTQGGSANVLKVSQEEFAKLVDKILKGSDSGFKKLYEMSKLIKLDANGEKAKKIIEVLSSNKNMAIITSSLFAISYAISYLLKKPAKKVEKQFAENTNLTKGNMDKIENTINKQIKKVEEKTKSQIKTLVKN